MYQMSNILTILFNILNFLILKIYTILLHHLTVGLPMSIRTRTLLLLRVITTLYLLHL